MTRSRAKDRWIAFAAGSFVASAGLWWALERVYEPARTTRIEFVEHPVTKLDGAEPSDLTGLKWRPLTDAEIDGLNPFLNPLDQRDPLCVWRPRASADFECKFEEHPGGKFRVQTNRLGLREREEVAELHPDLRIVVTGDSHTAGVCGVEKTFTNVLERLLRERRPDWTIEALNAGVGGYGFYNYLGMLERLAPLEPDVFITCVFGGNDFDGSLLLHAAFQGLAQPPGHSEFKDELAAAEEIGFGPTAQGLCAVRYFSQYPAQVDVALDGALAVSREIAARCTARGVVPIFVYLPAQHDVEWRKHRELMDELATILSIPPADRDILDRLADRYLAGLRENGVALVDLRPAFRASAEELYWRSDAHINVAAHALVAHELSPVVTSLTPERSAHAGRRTQDVSAPGAAPSAFEWAEPARLRALPPLDRVSASPIERPSTTARPPEVLVIGDELLGVSTEERTHFGRELADALRSRIGDDSVSASVASAADAGIHNALVTARQSLPPLPKVVVVLTDGASDFLDALLVEKERADGARAPVQRPRGWLASVRRFRNHPTGVRDALHSMLRATLALAEDCRARGQELVILYVPPPCDPRWSTSRASIESARAAAEVTTEDVARLVNTGRRFVEAVRHFGLEIHELGQPLSAAGSCPFDRESLELTAEGRTMLADAVAEIAAVRLR